MSVLCPVGQSCSAACDIVVVNNKVLVSRSSITDNSRRGTAEQEVWTLEWTVIGSDAGTPAVTVTAYRKTAKMGTMSTVVAYGDEVMSGIGPTSCGNTAVTKREHITAETAVIARTVTSTNFELRDFSSCRFILLFFQVTQC